MRRITLWFFSTFAAVVLLFSYRTSTNATEPPAATVRAAEPAPTTTGAGSTTGTRTYSGGTASTRWGDVQVTITVADGRITDVRVPVHPSGNGRDLQINSYALPILVRETLDAQSAQIDTVSGATVTTDGYRHSLQAALDAAHLS
jgi:uncharacterized protein with FMN-binding domain